MFSLLAIAFALTAAADETPKDYINAGKQIKFNDTTYKLKWSANPSQNYYKQEYLQHGSTLENYKEMITIDVLVGNISPEQAVEIKTDELKARKASDPVTNFQVFKKDNEYVLDFCICDGKRILEWNLYRYVKVNKASKEYLVLIAYTKRGTLDEGKSFFKTLKESRNEMILSLDKLALPKMRK